MVERKHLHYRVKPNEPARAVLDQHSHANYNFYGHVKSKAAHSLWRVKFDLFPEDQAPLEVARSHIKKVLRPDDEAPAYDREQDSEPEDLPPTEAGKKADKKKGKKDYVKESLDSFTKLDRQAILDARSFKYRYGEKEEDVVNWQILSEEEQIIACPMEQALAAKEAEHRGDPGAKPGGMSSGRAGARTEGVHSPMEKYTPLRNEDTPWNSDPKKVDWSAVWSKYFWPSMTGKAKVADQILGDRRCGYYNSAHTQGIRFHRPGDDDPDALVSILFCLCCFSRCGSHPFQNLDQEVLPVHHQVGNRVLQGG